MKNKDAHLRVQSTVVLIALGLILVGPSLPSAAQSGERGYDGETGTAAPGVLANPLVFVRQTKSQRSFASMTEIFGNMESCSQSYASQSRSNLFRLDPDGTLTDLTALSRGAVRDPEISPDGTSILFSMRETDCARWQVYEMTVESSHIRKLSQESRVNDLDPAYLPDGRIVFTSDRLRWADRYKEQPAAQLYTMNDDGSAVSLLSNNPNGQFNPLVSSDGMIYFTQWDAHFYDRLCNGRGLGRDTCPLNSNRFTLWKIHIDGSREGHPSFGQHLAEEASGFTGIRELPWQPGTFIASFSSQTCFGGGPLVLITPDQDLNFDLDSPVYLTEAYGNPGTPRGSPRESRLLIFADSRLPRYRDPYPLADGRFIASYAADYTCDLYAGSSYLPPDYSLVLLNGDGSEQTVIHADPDMWSLQAVELVPCPVYTLAEGSSHSGFDYGILNSLDVHNRGQNCDRVEVGDCQPAIRPGEAATLRVFRLHGKSYPLSTSDYRAPRDVHLGDVPIQADGSFAAVVPALTPLIWQVLDANDEILVSEPFVSEVAKGEVRQCAGCHGPHDGELGSVTNMALDNPTNLTGLNVDLNENGIVDLLEAFASRQASMQQ